MNRRGTVLVTTMLALLLTAALATAALAAARLRFLAGSRSMAAVRATLLADERLESYLAGLDPVALESLAVAVPVPLAPGDTLRRLGPSLYQVKVAVEVALPDGMVVARDGAAILIELLPACPLMERHMVSTTTKPGWKCSATSIRWRRIVGGWWRIG